MAGSALPQETTNVPEKRLPPGQYIPRGWPVLHYGPVPKFRPADWHLRVFGATASGCDHVWDWPGFDGLPKVEVTADLHCVTKFTVPDNRWKGVAASTVIEAVAPHPDVTHVLVWAEYGYSANLRIADFLAETTLFATHHDGERLSPEHGFPVRLVVPHLYAWKSVKWVRGIEYLTADRRGFWEERGYHNHADPWKEERYSYQEGQDSPPSL